MTRMVAAGPAPAAPAGRAAHSAVAQLSAALAVSAAAFAAFAAAFAAFAADGTGSCRLLLQRPAAAPGRRPTCSRRQTRFCRPAQRVAHGECRAGGTS